MGILECNDPDKHFGEGLVSGNSLDMSPQGSAVTKGNIRLK